MIASELSRQFCAGCGSPSNVCKGCLLEFEPPHFCHQCGRWIVVRIFPDPWFARCPEHGDVRTKFGEGFVESPVHALPLEADARSGSAVIPFDH